MLRILCVRFSSIGDVLLTTPLVRALHRRHPDAELYFVTNDRKFYAVDVHGLKKLRTDLDHFWTGALAAFKAVVEGTDKEKS